MCVCVAGGGELHHLFFCLLHSSIVLSLVGVFLLMCLLIFVDVFVVTKHVFCCDKSMLVTTNIFLSQQKNVCHSKRFVTTSLLLL